jgi:hypothetical protein
MGGRGSTIEGVRRCCLCIDDSYDHVNIILKTDVNGSCKIIMLG